MNVPTNRVLLVEDNPENRLLAQLLLEGEGWEVVMAVNGAEGIARATTESFVMVLLDLQLPDIDGFEVARRIRARVPAAELPIVAVSAFAMPGDRRKAFAAGCTGYLEKPIDPDAFAAQVRCMLGVEFIS